MSKLFEYLDRERATIAILRDYHDQMWKIENDPKRIKELIEDAVSPKAMSSVPVQGGGSRSEEMLCKTIDKKDLINEGISQAREYKQEFLPCWERLTNEERKMLELRFIEYPKEYLGIEKIMEIYHLGKTNAYNKSNDALKRLSRLMFF